MFLPVVTSISNPPVSTAFSSSPSHPEAYILVEAIQQRWITTLPREPRSSLISGAARLCGHRSNPEEDRPVDASARELILNYFRAQKQFPAALWRA
jgi:hypothetical protein